MKINKIVIVLTISNLFWTAGLGFIAPIFAIFVTRQIIGGDAEVAGFASSIYLGIFCLARLISAKWVDKKMNDIQSLYLLIFGGILVALGYILYISAHFPWQMYLLQSLIGIGTGFNNSPGTAFFTRFIDKGEESFEWGINAVAAMGGQAVTAALGGILAVRFGFNLIFILVGFSVLLASLVPVTFYKNLKSNYEKPRNRQDIL